MVMSFTYAIKTGALKEFLQKVKSKELGVPDKVNRDYLKSIGYTSSNDLPIIRVLKSIGFIDKSNIPTQYFRDFRTERSGQVMVAGLRKAYSELFKTYPRPRERGREELENFFAMNKPSLKKFTLGLYVDTFKTLCEFADFKAIPIKEAEAAKPGKEIMEVAKVTTQVPTSITVNLNIHLPATEDARVYEKIFKSLDQVETSPAYSLFAASQTFLL
jgi:hypothetical protein